MARGDLTQAQWKRLRPLLPPQQLWTGKMAHDHHDRLRRTQNDDMEGWYCILV